MDIIQAAKILRPGTDWNCTAGVLSQAIDEKDRVTVPTAEELQALIDADSYKELRRDAYPSLADLADALVHKENGDATQYNAYISACNAIKAQYPKPS